MVNGTKSVSHLIYADDVLVCTKANIKSLKASKEVLGIFSNFSGLDMNEEKSSTYFSKSVEGLTHIQEVLGFCVKALPLTYLGILISGKRKHWSVSQSHAAFGEHSIKMKGEVFIIWGKIEESSWSTEFFAGIS